MILLHGMISRWVYRTVRDKYETIYRRHSYSFIRLQTEGPTFEQTIEQQGNIYGGRYPPFIEDADGEEVENPISIVKE